MPVTEIESPYILCMCKRIATRTKDGEFMCEKCFKESEAFDDYAESLGMWACTDRD